MPRSSFTDARGTIMVEALVMLPAFLVIWGCLQVAAGREVEDASARRASRACAWAAAFAGCRGPAPHGCRLELDEDDEGGRWVTARDAHSRHRGRCNETPGRTFADLVTEAYDALFR